jgi:hypothetical protein
MKKLLLTLVGVAFLSFVQAQSFKFSVGYGLPWLSQQIGTNSSSTYSTALDPDTGVEVPRVTNASKSIKGSYGAGINISGAFGYTLSENIALELGISYSAGKEYKVTSNYTDTRMDVFQSSTYESETSKARAVLFTPLLKFITHKRNFTPYFLIGPVFGKMNFNQAMVRSTQENDVLSTEVRNTKFRGGISVGLRGAVGASVVLNRKLSLFSEIMFTGMNYYPKESEIVRYTVNGEDKISLLTENSRKTLYVKSVDNDSGASDDYINTPGKAVRSPLSMSSVGANIGVLINLN